MKPTFGEKKKCRNPLRWILNAVGTKSINIFTPDKQWFSFGLASQSDTIPLYTPGEIMVDRRNTQWKWIPQCRYNTGLLLLQDNGTPTNDKDDQVFYRNEWYDQNGKPVIPEYIYSMAQDHDNTIWVGTNAGLFLIPATIDFTTSNRCERVIISRNDGTKLGDYLLDNEQINHIVVDGANRKWIATATSGVFLLSSNGEETIEHFTTENSPLSSNNVLSIAILESTGEVFFGTSQGLVSYMSDAIEPAKNFSDIYAYPNPVHPNLISFEKRVNSKRIYMDVQMPDRSIWVKADPDSITQVTSQNLIPLGKVICWSIALDTV